MGSLLPPTAYDRLSLRLVDNDTGDAETLALLDRVSRAPRVTIARDPRRFNFSAPFYHPALTLRDTSCRLRAPDEQPSPP